MKKVTNKILWLFAIGQLGWSILSGVVTNWLVFYYQPDQATLDKGHIIFITQGAVFLGLTVIGLIAALGRLFDAVTDPIIASCSDNCKNKNGRRIPFMKFIAIPFGLITTLLFISPLPKESMINNIFLLCTMLLFYLCMTIYCTPYNALIPELGKNQKDRINLSTFISITYFLGTSMAYLVPNIASIFEPNLGYTNAFRLTIAILSIIAIICMYVPVFTIKEKDFCDSKPLNDNAFTSLIKTFKNKEFKKFVGSDIFYWIALTIFQTGFPFYVTALMHLDESMTFVLFIIMTVLSLICYLPVNILAKKFGKKKMIIFAFIIFSIAFVLTSFSGIINIQGLAWGIIIAIIAAFPMAILGILPQAVVADIADSEIVETGENRDGMFFAARTFAFKLGQSVAMLIFTGLAKIGDGIIGYRISAIVAAILCLIGMIILLFYNENKVLSEISGSDSNE